MSIYGTRWVIRLPRNGDFHPGCEWVEMLGQGVPAHIGTPAPGHGYEDGDPYSEFLPPAILSASDEDDEELRAMVVVTRGAPKGTARSGQEYVEPLLVLSGDEYRTMGFDELITRISNTLRENESAARGTGDS